MTTKRRSIATKSLAVAGVVLVVFAALSIVHDFKGIEASKEDPEKLFMFYVQDPIQQGISVQSAVGHANFGGTCITFQLRISNKAIDSLIASKRLRKSPSMQQNLFLKDLLEAMTRPEFYEMHEDRTWSSIGTTAMMAIDGSTNIALYLVFSP